MGPLDKIKEEHIMKRLLLSLGIMLAIASSVQALPFTFSGSMAGGTGSATMDIEIVDNTLIATVNNTSSINLDGGSNDGGNSPGIMGFGFDLLPNTLTWTSWDLKAFTSDLAAVTIGSDVGGSYEWDMGTRIGGINLDYLPNTFGSISGALFNPCSVIRSEQHVAWWFKQYIFHDSGIYDDV